MSTETAVSYCSFCGKASNEVRKLIAGPGCFICNECVELCSDICTVEGAPPKYGLPWGELIVRLGQFCTEYGIKREADLRLLSDMCFALGAEPQFEMRARDRSADADRREAAGPEGQEPDPKGSAHAE